MLIVEPDPLTQWALKMYLARWFAVDSTDSIVGAQEILDARPVDALVMSNELPSIGLASLEERARNRTAEVVIVRTVADPGKPRLPGARTGYLEKPFELAQLGRLLGIPESELPHEA